MQTPSSILVFRHLISFYLFEIIVNTLALKMKNMGFPLHITVLHVDCDKNQKKKTINTNINIMMSLQLRCQK